MKINTKGFALLALMTLNGCLLFGQQNNNKMKMNKPNVIVQTKINAPADKVWAILVKQFPDISNWTSFVESSKALTADEISSDYTPAANAAIPARQTTVGNKGKTSTLVEIVTMYSDERWELIFYGLGLPKFIEYASDKQSVIVNGENECTVVFDVKVRLKGIFKLFKGKAEKRFAENFKKVQNDLKIYAETGKESNRT